MSACKGGYISVVQYLEAQGANVNAKDGVSHPVHLKFINFSSTRKTQTLIISQSISLAGMDRPDTGL